MSTELFANQAQTTVTSGGTTAPSPGTSESWTVSSSAGFPAAATGVSFFRVTDTAASSEKMIVTNVSGTTWTVTRGAEGTTPVTHSSGFAVQNVITAASLAGLVQSVLSATAPVLYPTADTSGTTDTAAVAAAMAALPSSGGTVKFAPGTFYLTCGGVANTVAGSVGPVYFQGSGTSATTLSAVGTGDVLRANSTTTTGPPPPGGGILDLTIDGTNAGAGSAGIHVGDLGFYQFSNVTVLNFTGAGSIGVHFDNQFTWAEKIHGTIKVKNCTSHYVFDVSGAGVTSTNSFGYGRLNLWVDAAANQDGVVLQNGALWYHGALSIQGNFASSTSAQTSAVLRVTGTVPAGHPSAGSGSSIQASQLDIDVEGDTNHANLPQTINFGAQLTNAVYGCYGNINFAFGGTFTASNINVAGSGGYGTFRFLGGVSGDVNLGPASSSGAAVAGALLYGQSFMSPSAGTVHTVSGDFFSCTLSASVTIDLSPSSEGNKTLGGPQRKTIIIKQAASGGPFTVTWPHAGSPTTTAETVLWAGGTAPTMTATANAVDVYRLDTYDGATWYGTASQNVS